MNHYILIGHEVVRTQDVMEWARWIETANRKVRHTSIGFFEVSTVFLGFDHNFVGDRPLLFETMVFCIGEPVVEPDRSPVDLSNRYSTWDEAVAGHESICDQVRHMVGSCPPVDEEEEI